MKSIKRLLLLSLIFILSLTAAALAENKPEAWEGRVLKLTLESGLRLNVNEYEYDFPEISELSFGGGDTWSESTIPVYSVHIPTGTQYVYMYAYQDAENNSDYAYSLNGYYYACEIEVDNGSAICMLNNYNQFPSLEMEEQNIVAPDTAGDDPYEQTLAKVKLPVVTGTGDNGGDRMLVFQQYQNYPFALHFVEESVDTSVVPAEDVKISGSAVWNLDRQSSISLDAYVHPTGATNASQLTWSSSDESILSIGSTAAGDNSVDGDYALASSATLAAHKNGTATITASCGSVTYDFPVEVRNCPDPDPVVDALALDKSAATIWHFASGQEFPSTGYEDYRTQFPASLTLTASAKAGEDIIEDACITWSSSNESVASVNNGVVTPLSAGEATITAACGDITASCTVTVNAFVAPGYANVSVGADWVDPSLPSGLKNKPNVLDLSSDAQPRTFTVVGSVYKNVGADKVKTLSSIQAMTWTVTDENDCISYTDDGNGTLTVTATGNSGVVTFLPVLLNGEHNERITIHFSDGFVTNASIVRTDGKPWTYSETITIGEKTHNVFNMVQGEAISVRIDTPDNDITHSYDGWNWYNRNTQSQDMGVNGATYDLSTLKPGLYELSGRTPMYEQDYNIDPLGMNRQNALTIKLYIRVNEKPAVTLGDVNNDGSINASDAATILMYSASLSSLTSAQLEAADMNDDGSVNSIDAALLLQSIAS